MIATKIGIIDPLSNLYQSSTLLDQVEYAIGWNKTWLLMLTSSDLRKFHLSLSPLLILPIENLKVRLRRHNGIL